MAGNGELIFFLLQSCKSFERKNRVIKDRIYIIILLIAMVCILSAKEKIYADMYRYVDNTGTVVYTDDLSVVPESQRKSALVFEDGKTKSDVDSEGQNEKDKKERLPKKEGDEANFGKELQKRKAFLDKELEKLQAEKARLEKERLTLKSEKQRQEYQEKAQKYNQKIKKYNQKKRQLNKKIEQFNQRLAD